LSAGALADLIAHFAAQRATGTLPKVLTICKKHRRYSAKTAASSGRKTADVSRICCRTRKLFCVVSAFDNGADFARLLKAKI